MGYDVGSAAPEKEYVNNIPLASSRTLFHNLMIKNV